MKNKNIKSILIIILCLAIVVSFWVITLKLNLQKGFENKSRSGLTFEQLISEINKIVKKSPLTKKEVSPENNLDEITEKLADELKNLETDEFADWQTYTHEQYGLEFKYPDSKTITINGNEITINENNLYWKMIIYQNENKYDLKNWFNNYFNESENKDCEELGSNIDIGTYESKLFSSSSMDDSCLDGGYYVISNDQLKVIKIVPGHDAGENFTEILSTFKFLNGEVQGVKIINTLPTLE